MGLAIVFVLNLLALPVVAQGTQWVQIHDMSADEIENTLYVKRYKYFEELVVLLLRESCELCKVKKIQFPAATSTRNIKHLNKGRIDIAWMNTTKQRERELLAIRYPIYRGLIGWRLLLIKNGDQQRFSKVENPAQLRALWAGQGHDWPDTQVLRHAGLGVRTSDNWHGIMNLLYQGRIDYFPRGLNEIQFEAESLKDRDIVIEKHLALYYPAAFYLFVARDNQELAMQLTHGFEAALHDGEFDKLFERYFGEDIQKARLSQRRILRFSNPELSAATPLARQELWFSPASKLSSSAAAP